MPNPIKIVELDFTTLRFFKNYVVSVVKEDQNVDMDSTRKLHVHIEKFYKNRMYGYISDRQNHYSVNPLIHIQPSKKMAGMAIVCNSDLKKMTAMFEKNFSKKPFRVFDRLPHAKNWMEGLLQEADPR